MVTSLNKSVQPRNCEATRSFPTEKGNTLSRAAAYVTEHRQALHANFCEILPACCWSLLYPTRAFSSRAGTLARSQWVPGPPAFWLTQGQAPGAQASGSGGRARDIPRGFPQGPGRSSGLGNAGGQWRRGPSSSPPRRRGPRNSRARSAAKPRELSFRGQEGIQPEKEKKKSRWTPAPAGKPTEAAAPLRPRVALTHSPLLRLHRRRRDHNRSPLRAPPRDRPDHAPDTPLCVPALQPTDLPDSAGVSAGLRDLSLVTLVESSSELRQPTRTSLAHPPRAV